MSRDPLALDRETMRRMGHEVVDLIVDRLAVLAEEPVLRMATRPEMERRLAEPAPAEARDFSDLLRRLDADVLPFGAHWDHPRNFSYIPGSGTWPAALGDLVASAMNIDSGAWREAAGASQPELTVLDWFRDWIGYPDGASGILVSGGSAANLAAIACAREVLVGPMSTRIVAYVGDQSHSSIARAARHLGFRPDQVRVIPTDAGLRMHPGDLASAMEADVKAGRLPFLVSAVAGSTNTGAVDDLPTISTICRERGVWLHVDAAYGGFAVLTERGRARLAGLALADSITLDPHKWLLMPFEVGCLMVRSPGHLEHAFSIHPEYLAERAGGRGEVDFADRGLQLTRATRAIKVWLALQAFGVDAYREATWRSRASLPATRPPSALRCPSAPAHGGVPGLRDREPCGGPVQRRGPRGYGDPGVFAVCRSASVSVSAGRAPRASKISRAWRRTGRASAGRPSARRERPWPRSANPCSGTTPKRSQRSAASA